MTCRVCGGRRLITLCVMPIMSVTHEGLESPSAHHKDFLCPGCAPQAPAEKVDLIKFEGQYTQHHRDQHPDYLDYEKRKMAVMMGRHLLEKDLISFTEEKNEKDLEFGFSPRLILRGVVGVVSKEQVATMQERIEQHQHAFACEVAAEAIAQIENWGSYFGHSHVSKDMARQTINDAVSTVLDRRNTKANKV